MNGPIKNALAVQKTNFLIICAIEVQTVIEIHEPGTGTFPDEVMTSFEKLQSSCLLRRISIYLIYNQFMHSLTFYWTQIKSPTII